MSASAASQQRDSTLLILCLIYECAEAQLARLTWRLPHQAYPSPTVCLRRRPGTLLHLAAQLGSSLSPNHIDVKTGPSPVSRPTLVAQTSDKSSALGRVARDAL